MGKNGKIYNVDLGSIQGLDFTLIHQGIGNGNHYYMLSGAMKKLVELSNKMSVNFSF